MKKTIAIVLCIILVLAVSLPAAAITTTKATPASKVTTLKMFVIGNGQEPDTDRVTRAIDTYLKKSLNINLKLTTIGWGNYDTKINMMLSSGQKFDIVFTAAWAANYRNNAAAGFFTDLTPMLKDSQVTATVGQDFLNGSKIGGKNYGCPTFKETAHNWGVLLLKSMVDKYKVDVTKIKKLSDLEATFAQIKAGEPGMIPLLSVDMDAPWHLLDFDTISDDDIPGSLYSDNTSPLTIFNQFTSPEALAQYKQMNDYYKKGWLAADAATMTNFQTQMSTGKYFAVVQPLKPGKDIEMNATTKQTWVQVDLTPIIMSNRECSGALLAIPKASVNKERAFKFIEALYTDKTLINMMELGIEGIHYKKVSDNVISVINPTKSTYNPGNNWRFGNQFNNYLTAEQDPTIWSQFIKYNKAGLPLRSLGFLYNNKDSVTEAAACKAVTQTYYKQLFTGSAKDTDATIAKMTAEYKAAGVDKLLADMQKQFDAWYKK